MILKALSRRGGNSGALIQYVMRYVLSPEKQVDVKNQFIIRHNVTGNNLSQWVKQFQEIEANRTHKSSRDIINQHFILSFLKEDSVHLTDEVVRDLVDKFIELRGENIAYIGARHYDKSHPHVHLAAAATQLNGRSARISKEALKQIKLELDAYQKTRYPELLSLPGHGKTNEKNIEAIVHRSGRLSQKEVLQSLVSNLLKTTESREEFLEKLQAAGHQPYYMGEKLQGIQFEDGLKFKLSGLGITEEQVAKLDTVITQEQKELEELQALRWHSMEHELENVRTLNIDESAEMEGVAGLHKDFDLLDDVDWDLLG